MLVTKVGSRGTLFTFDELKHEMGCTTNVYVINTPNRVFICDTYLGPDSMRSIKDYVLRYMGNKPLVIFNSHSHWDHVWGNCTFREATIIAHDRCREQLLKIGKEQLDKHGQLAAGTVDLVLPQLTFSESISFPDDGIQLFYSPGHTDGSSSCYDTVDQVLFVGDNIEAPHPYLQSNNLHLFLETLLKYQQMNVATFVAGHGQADHSLLAQNIAYLQSLV